MEGDGGGRDVSGGRLTGDDVSGGRLRDECERATEGEGGGEGCLGIGQVMGFRGVKIKGR